MAYGGKGVARVGGKVFFVADAVPGDLLKARVTNDAGRYAEAEISEILSPSPLRTPPLCQHAKICGGCQWMGIDYATQLEWKRSFVEQALKRIGKLPDHLSVEISPSPEIYHYRNRILLRAHLSSQGKLDLGYFRRGSRDLVPISRCEIAGKRLNRVIEQLYALPLQGMQALKVRLELQEVPFENERVVVTVYPSEGRSEDLERLVGLIGSLPEVVWAGTILALGSASALNFDRDLELTFLTLPGQFQQVNVAHNHALRRLVKEAVDAQDPARILDVFCGSGNLSLPLANGKRYVEGIESNKKAIGIAKKNVAANNLSNTRYLAGDAEAHLWKCSKAGEVFDLVILDPPRQGMFKGMVPLKNLAPKDIIYVSCDPSTLARDLGYLCRNHDYTLTKVVGFDFFPNTYHVETVAFLQRSQ